MGMGEQIMSCAIGIFTPKSKQSFWCSVCDAVEVHSDDPTTGTFYNIFGHQWNHQTQDCGDYHMVIFAVCHNCKPDMVELKSP